MPRVKRTYNLDPETVRRVRELASRYGTAESQDGVVELAVERLYREVAEREEAERWAAAAQDPAFRSEMRDLEAAYRDRAAWPER
jgi:hypothetical protein